MLSPHCSSCTAGVPQRCSMQLGGETPDPQYTEEARRAKYEGACVLAMIVGAAGKPRDIRVQRGLGMGLDQKALEAVKRRFDPATKDGRPVAVQISVEVSFKLY
jgi:periplasmic protein TonB